LRVRVGARRALAASSAILSIVDYVPE
jgi:hypothetical protein